MNEIPPLTYAGVSAGDVFPLPRLFPEIEGTECHLKITKKDEHGVEADVFCFKNHPICTVEAVRFNANDVLLWETVDVE